MRSVQHTNTNGLSRVLTFDGVFCLLAYVDRDDDDKLLGRFRVSHCGSVKLAVRGLASLRCAAVDALITGRRQWPAVHRSLLHWGHGAHASRPVR